MDDKNIPAEKEKAVIKKCVEKLTTGKLPPWKSELVSLFQNIYARIDKKDVIYDVELPNVEVGVLSTPEGLIPPVGREALKIMGVRTAREFAALMAA
jgi:hypothetical protein